MRPLQIIVFALILIFVSCDEGLSPDLAKAKSGFEGIITFRGEWDPNINQTHIVVFKDPLLSIEDFNVFNLNFVSESIPNGSQTYEYTTNDENSLISTIEPGVISYIAVAQSLKDTITLNREDWHVIGLYYAQNDSINPGSLVIGEGEYLNNINITCDFDNPPIQPPGGANNFSKRSVMKNKFKETFYE